MKIAFVSDMYNPYVAGVVTFIDILAEEYIREGHEVVVFTHFRSTNPLKKKGVRLVTFWGIPSLIYPGTWIVLPNPLTFENIVRKEAPDIIHSHTPGLLSSLAQKAGKNLGIPTVITFHGFMDHYYKYFSISHILHLNWIPFPQVSWYDNFRKYLIRTFMRNHVNRFDAVTASTPLTKKLVEQQGIPSYLVRIGLDIATFHPKKTYTKTNRILSVSRLGFEKKIDIVLRAMAQLQNPELKLTIVGDGPAKKMLRDTTKKLGLQNQVTFTGQVPRENLQKYFETHDFFVNASDTETFGYVTAEAMAGGLPIVGVKSQGTGELVKNGKNGFLAEPNNPESFAKAIQKMLAVPNYQQIGNASVQMVQAYSPENSAKEHLALYQKLIRQSQKQIL
ncbi:MAG TPA: glycosyltransferase [Candidatus Paceibacterota bacterium]